MSMSMAAAIAAVIVIETTKRAIALTPEATRLGRISMVSLPVRSEASLPSVTSYDRMACRFVTLRDEICVTVTTAAMRFGAACRGSTPT